jgi:DNA polymerase-3 subunit chi
MTKIDFYTGVDDKLRTACRLCHEAMQSGQRVLLHTPDEAIAKILDTLLWQHPVTSFMPHCHNNEPAATGIPIVVAHHGENFPHHEVLITLHTECLPFFSRFERVFEIVSQDAEDIRLGRKRFSYYRDRGYEMYHTKLNKHIE